MKTPFPAASFLSLSAFRGSLEKHPGTRACLRGDEQPWACLAGFPGLGFPLRSTLCVIASSSLTGARGGISASGKGGAAPVWARGSCPREAQREASDHSPPSVVSKGPPPRCRAWLGRHQNKSPLPRVHLPHIFPNLWSCWGGKTRADQEDPPAGPLADLLSAPLLGWGGLCSTLDSGLIWGRGKLSLASVWGEARCPGQACDHRPGLGLPFRVPGTRRPSPSPPGGTATRWGRG